MVTPGACSSCGADIASDATVCPACGTARAPESGKSGSLAAPNSAISGVQTASKRPWRFPASALGEHLAKTGLVDAVTVRALGDEASARPASFVGLLVERKHVAPAALRDAAAT